MEQCQLICFVYLQLNKLEFDSFETIECTGDTVLFLP